jgi:hypothetical protein
VTLAFRKTSHGRSRSCSGIQWLYHCLRQQQKARLFSSNWRPKVTPSQFQTFIALFVARSCDSKTRSNNASHVVRYIITFGAAPLLRGNADRNICRHEVWRHSRSRTRANLMVERERMTYTNDVDGVELQHSRLSCSDHLAGVVLNGEWIRLRGNGSRGAALLDR